MPSTPSVTSSAVCLAENPDGPLNPINQVILYFVYFLSRTQEKVTLKLENLKGFSGDLLWLFVPSCVNRASIIYEEDSHHVWLGTGIFKGKYVNLQ